MAQDKVKIGIIGGMGPEATLDLFRKILRNTPANKDQDHLHLIIDNKNPLPFILESARLLESAGVNAICMACNTAHVFESDIKAYIHVDFIRGHFRKLNR